MFPSAAGMPTFFAVTSRQLEFAWQHLRFTLRYAVKEYVPSQTANSNALPLTAADPAQITPFLRSVLATLELVGHEGEASPVLRSAKMLLKPSPAHRARKDLAKSFESYRAAWNETHALAERN